MLDQTAQVAVRIFMENENPRLFVFYIFLWAF